MTTEQREKIIDLRKEGYGYATIANALGITKDSVKSFCRSHNLAGKKAEDNRRIELAPDSCLNCGKPILQKDGLKKRKFCCPSCRTLWWNTHPESVNRKAIYHFHCPTCGTDFTAYGNSHRKYCSHACYITARFKGGDKS